MPAAAGPAAESAAAGVHLLEALYTQFDGRGAEVHRRPVEESREKLLRRKRPERLASFWLENGPFVALRPGIRQDYADTPMSA